MTGWAARRFWKAVTFEEVEGGFTVRLDGRPVKTPAKTPLVVPSEGLARAIAAEWEAQEGTVRPETMPVTRSANSALDKVIPQKAAVVAMLAEYGGTDLICYRAAGPETLVERQSKGWDALVDWAATSLGAPLVTTVGVIHVAQDPAVLARLQDRVAAMDAFRIAAFHDLVTISGSLVLAFAVTEGRLDAERAWTLSRIDEDWQTEQWGEDEEAAALARSRHDAFVQAARFYGLCG